MKLKLVGFLLQPAEAKAALREIRLPSAVLPIDTSSWTQKNTLCCISRYLELILLIRPFRCSFRAGLQKLRLFRMKSDDNCARTHSRTHSRSHKYIISSESLRGIISVKKFLMPYVARLMRAAAAAGYAPALNGAAARTAKCCRFNSFRGIIIVCF